jgi:hypothetical protein
MSSLIKTDDLDFADIKRNLKAFLSSQTELQDYDFDGSVISTLIDLLAYNTHYNSLYTNLSINEMFIDSASKRSSLASIAKLMGYTPRSVTASTAIVDLTVKSPSNPATLTIPAGTRFTTENSGKAYTFNLMDDVSAVRSSGNSYVFTGLKISEGELLSTTYVTDVHTKYVIPNASVDMSKLRVSVGGVAFVAAKSMVGVRATDKVYYTNLNESGLYEIYFGDGVFGVSVPVGSVVKIRYLASTGAAANGNILFSYSGGSESTNQYSVIATQLSSNGGAAESRDSIRYYAPLYYQSQDRAVTSNDYAAIVSTAYPEIETVMVWGGQDNVPPQYGKVFIAAKPYGRDFFTDAEKRTFAYGVAKVKGVITVTPQFVDPKYMDIEFTSNIYYDPSVLTRQIGDIETDVRYILAQYQNKLAKFETAYRHSYLTQAISAVDASIVSTINTVRVRTNILPQLNVATNYSVKFGNPIQNNATSTFYSTRFYLFGYTDRGYIKNVGADLYFFTEAVDGTASQQIKVGTLDFAGSVSLIPLMITGKYDLTFEFVFYPSSYDVIPLNGYILRIPNNHIKVNMIVDAISQTRSAKTEHIFSAS